MYTKNTHTHTHIKLLISRFLQNPILESLIDFTDPNMNRVASEIFLGEMRDKLQPLKFTFVYNFFGMLHTSRCISVIVWCVAIMKFMGDHPLRGQSEQFVVCTFLKVKHNLSSVGPTVLLPIRHIDPQLCLIYVCFSFSFNLTTIHHCFCS